MPAPTREAVGFYPIGEKVFAITYEVYEGSPYPGMVTFLKKPPGEEKEVANLGNEDKAALRAIELGGPAYAH